MQFRFDSGVTATGWAVKPQAADPATFFGYNVALDADYNQIVEIQFTIPELRQMLAEAEELAEQESIDNGDFGPIGDCPDANCDCGSFAPLADEGELIEDFIDRLNAKTAKDGEIEALLNRASLLASADTKVADTLVKIAYARRDLL